MYLAERVRELEAHAICGSALPSRIWEKAVFLSENHQPAARAGKVGASDRLAVLGTDAKLVNRAREILVRLAQKRGHDNTDIARAGKFGKAASWTASMSRWPQPAR